jgi:DNA-binding transcriptional LysR family regulator
MELRHLRYFTAVVQWRGYREASRHLHIAQPSISETVADLEQELDLKLFSRVGRTVQLTPEGEVFYTEAVRTLAQADSAIDTAKRAAKGEIGTLSIGFLGAATMTFLPELVRSYKAQYPGVKLTLQDLTSVQQQDAFDKGLIDIGFTRTLTPERSKTFSSRCLYREPLVAVLPVSKKVKTKRVRITDLANEPFVLFHRENASKFLDTVERMCNDAGFAPRVEYWADRWPTVLWLVEAEEGVCIAPASVRHLSSNGVRFYRLQPDDVRVELVVAWKKERPSAVVRSFLDLVDANASQIQKKAELV